MRTILLAVLSALFADLCAFFAYYPARLININIFGPNLAITEFQKAVDINPGFARAHNNLGIVLAQKGRDDEAIGHFEKALDTNADDTDAAAAQYNLGSALMRKGRTEKAAVDFRKALISGLYSLEKGKWTRPQDNSRMRCK